MLKIEVWNVQGVNKTLLNKGYKMNKEKIIKPIEMYKKIRTNKYDSLSNIDSIDKRLRLSNIYAVKNTWKEYIKQFKENNE